MVPPWTNGSSSSGGEVRVTVSKSKDPEFESTWPQGFFLFFFFLFFSYQRQGVLKQVP